MAAFLEFARTQRARQVGRLAALLLLVGCAVPEPAPATVAAPSQPQPTLAALQGYKVKPGVGTQCVPYARARTGIGLFGDAHTWWKTAAGRYARGSKPLVGAVLVLRKTSRLRHGHVGVVSAVVGPREIRVDHANWQPDAIITDMAVVDVSLANDWTQVRFWNKDARVWGSVYPAAGFIYNAPDGAPVSEDTGTTVISGHATHGPAQQPTP
jgi:surface antigen